MARAKKKATKSTKRATGRKKTRGRKKTARKVTKKRGRKKTAKKRATKKRATKKRGRKKTAKKRATRKAPKKRGRKKAAKRGRKKVGRKRAVRRKPLTPEIEAAAETPKKVAKKATKKKVVKKVAKKKVVKRDENPRKPPTVRKAPARKPPTARKAPARKPTARRPKAANPSGFDIRGPDGVLIERAVATKSQAEAIASLHEGASIIQTDGRGHERVIAFRKKKRSKKKASKRKKPVADRKGKVSKKARGACVAGTLSRKKGRPQPKKTCGIPKDQGLHEFSVAGNRAQGHRANPGYPSRGSNPDPLPNVSTAQLKSRLLK